MAGLLDLFRPSVGLLDPTQADQLGLLGAQAGTLPQSPYRQQLGALNAAGNALWDAMGPSWAKPLPSSPQDYVPGVTPPGSKVAPTEATRTDRPFGAAMDLLGMMPVGGAAKAAAPLVAAVGAARRATGSFSLDYFGQPVRILQNPSERTLQGFLSRTKYKAARRITDPETGDVYVWDANDPALHQLVAEQLGVTGRKWDTIGLD